MKYKIGFLGVGVMGGGLLKNILSKTSPDILNPEDICVFDIDSHKANSFKEFGVMVSSDINSLIINSDCLVIATKPQSFVDMFADLPLQHSKCIVSIMAGIKVKQIKDVFFNSTSIIRIMPNIPCLIGEGTIGMTDKFATKADTLFVKSVFSLCGKIYPIEEEDFDLFTCISGSGPAYLFYFAQSLIKAAEDMGFSRETSKEITLNTILGSTKYALGTNTILEELVNAVCSKGGTTIEAINVFNQEKLDQIIKDGMIACNNKAKKLSERL